MSSYNKFSGFNNSYYPNKSKMNKIIDKIYKSIDLELKFVPKDLKETQVLENQRYMESEILDLLFSWAGTWDEGRAIRAQGKPTYRGGRRRTRRKSKRQSGGGRVKKSHRKSSRRKSRQ